MTQKHTPGPWLHRHDKYEGDAVLAKGPRWVVQRVEDPDTGCDIVAIPNPADAHLIAAAPDMLEALKLADAALSGANMDMKAVEKAVRAAIAKAEGGDT